MARKVPEHVAFRLAQKARDADKKIKDAEKKAKAAEKKAKTAEKKAKAAEKKAKAAEEKADDSEHHDDFDNFDDFDDFDDDHADDPDTSSSDDSQTASQESSDSSDDELDKLLKKASESESTESKIGRANKLVKERDFNGALGIWKDLTASEGNEPANWRGLASVLEVRNQAGDTEKAITAREHADRLETEAIAVATGRNMEDIIADLLDDGILNFSAGSDAKE